MLTIGIVDDVDSNIDVLQLLLEEYLFDESIFNYEIVSYKSSLNAFNEITAHKVDIDLLFLDLMMPDMNGLKFLESINKLSLTKTPYIVVTTAVYSEAARKIEFQNGAKGYLSKPIERVKFIKILEQFFRFYNSGETIQDYKNFENYSLGD